MDRWMSAHGEDGENHAGADAGAPKLSKMKHVTFWERVQHRSAFDTQAATPNNDDI